VVAKVSCFVSSQTLFDYFAFTDNSGITVVTSTNKHVARCALYTLGQYFISGEMHVALPTRLPDHVDFVG